MEETKKKRTYKSVATIRKACKKGQRTQKMMSFKADIDVLEAMANEVNKGRLINELLRKHYGI